MGAKNDDVVLTLYLKYSLHVVVGVVVWQEEEVEVGLASSEAKGGENHHHEQQVPDTEESIYTWKRLSMLIF